MLELQLVEGPDAIGGEAERLDEAGIGVGYTSVFWGGRSEIKPSEIAPAAYVAWCREQGLDPEALR